MEYPVIQQPAGQAGYVSQQTNVVTEFSMPKKYGVTGSTCHNYLAGAEFFNLEVGRYHPGRLWRWIYFRI